MTRKEFERLDADYPEWKYLRHNAVYSRYWMYFADRVALARAEVHRRRLVAMFTVTLTPTLDAITKFLNRRRA